MSLLVIAGHTYKSSLEADINVIARRAASVTISERVVQTASGPAPAARRAPRTTRKAARART